MNFCSIEYLIFFPLIVLFYFITAYRYRWIILFAGSCLFYMWFITEYILYLFFLIIVDYLIAGKIYQTENAKIRKRYLWLSLVSNFGLLFYFKYSGFFTDNINLFLEPLFNTRIKISQELLPIGLSFHTFQSISYVLDVYYGKQKPEKHLGIYSNYVLFFPQMVAGPIETYSSLGENLKQNSSFSFSSLKSGVQLILIGYFYKMVIADNCGSYVNMTYNHLNTMGGLNILLAIAMFTVQIYCDFFGYSLIAQGSAAVLGIRLMDNFKNPLFSLNIIDFWRRWHISLTSWFRKYVFIPLGGSRQGKFKHIRNIAIVFLLSGLWHGGAWNFIIWGALHAFFYILAMYASHTIFFKIPVPVKYVLSFVIVAFIFVFFRNNLAAALNIFKASVNFDIPFKAELISVSLITNLIFIFLVELFERRAENYSVFMAAANPVLKTTVLLWMLFGILVFSTLDNLPFIYFQF